MAGSVGVSLEGFQRGIQAKVSQLGLEKNDYRKMLHAALSFYYAVDWTELWIQGLLVLELALIVSAVWLRKRQTAQVAFFAVAACVIFLGERINSWGSSNWERFSRHDYFDTHGLFVSVVVCGPMFLIALIAMFNYLMSTFHIMAKNKCAKRQQQEEAREAAKKKD